MNSFLISALLMLSVLFVPKVPPRSTSKPASRFHYTLRKKVIKDTEIVDFQVVQAHSSKTVFHHRTIALTAFAWSRNHRALAILDDKPGLEGTMNNVVGGYYRLIIWQAHLPVRAYNTVASLAELDAVGNLEWSPDNKRLMFLGTPNQGGLDVGGGLYILPVPVPDKYLLPKNQKRDVRRSALERFRVSKASILKAHWISSTTIRAWKSEWPNPSKKRTFLIHIR